MNPDFQAQDQLSTNETTAPYLKAQEINLWTCWAIGNWTPDPLHQQPVVYQLNYWGSQNP